MNCIQYHSYVLLLNSPYTKERGTGQFANACFLGDVYLRTLMIHGARAVVTRARHKYDRLSRWVTGIATRRHPNEAAVALANKTARMAWAMLRNKTDYDPDFAIR